MVPMLYFNTLQEIRDWSFAALPAENRHRRSHKYAEFRRAVLEWALEAVHKGDKALLEIVQTAEVGADGKIHINISKLDPRDVMTLSFLKMALFAYSSSMDVPIRVLFDNYAQHLGTLMILNGKHVGM